MCIRDRRYKKLIACARKTEFEFDLENDPSLIEPFVDLIQQVISSKSLLDSSGRVRLGVALEQALSNALFRGNLEIQRNETNIIDRQLVETRMHEKPWCDRRIYVNALITREFAQFVIRDEGPGFDVSKVPEPNDPDSFRAGVGRGLVLIKNFMDEVEFNDVGNQVTMIKRRS